VKLFEYAVLEHPERDEDGKVRNGKPSKLLVPVTTCVAKDQSQAIILAGRAIPDEALEHLDRLEVVVRPF
jgi:hypothetical protein